MYEYRRTRRKTNSAITTSSPRQNSGGISKYRRVGHKHKCYKFSNPCICQYNGEIGGSNLLVYSCLWWSRRRFSPSSPTTATSPQNLRRVIHESDGEFYHRRDLLLPVRIMVVVKKTCPSSTKQRSMWAVPQQMVAQDRPVLNQMK